MEKFETEKALINIKLIWLSNTILFRLIFSFFAKTNANAKHCQILNYYNNVNIAITIECHALNDYFINDEFE